MSNIYRALQDAVAKILADEGVETVVRNEPDTARVANAALNDSGEFVVVDYPAITVQEAEECQVELAVQVMANSEVCEHDGWDTALKAAGILANRQLDDEWWSVLRLAGVEATGNEDGLVVWTVTIRTATIHAVERTI